MIKKLKGSIDFIKDDFIILDVQSVGYQVFLGSKVLEYSLNQEIELFIHSAIRESSWDLYGFEGFNELTVFEMLLTISGVGPKAAMGIMDVTTPASLKKAVLTENRDSLTKVSGIGSKVASKIILELKNKIEKVDIKESDSEFDLEIYETLESLGFSRDETRKALKEISANNTASTTEEKIKSALKTLGK